MNDYGSVFIFLYILNGLLYEAISKPRLKEKTAKLLHNSLDLLLIPLMVLYVYNVDHSIYYDEGVYLPYVVSGGIIIFLLGKWLKTIYKYFWKKAEQA